MVIKLAFKVVIASSAVYYTNQLEIWEPLSHQERAYDRAIADMKKLINENKPKSLKLELPAIVNQDLCATTNHYYNRGVINTIEFLDNLPAKSCQLYSCAVKQISKSTTNATTTVQK